MTPLLLQQAILFAVSGVLSALAILAARRGRLTFGTAAMWSGIAALGFGAALILPFVNRIGLFLGLLPAAVLAATASAVLAAIAFTLSLRVSALESSLQTTIEALAITGLEPAQSSSPWHLTVAVVPAFNEEKTVGDVVCALLELGLPVIVVDDGSTDATSSVAANCGATVVVLATNLGVGGALRAGIRFAIRSGFDQVVQCDADGQHPSSAVRALLEAQSRDPHDLLIGSRFATSGTRRGQTLIRRTAMALLATFASRASGVKISDATSGLRVIRQPLLGELAQHLPRHYLGDTFEVLVSAGRAGYRVGEIPVTMCDRAYGTSSASFSAALGLTLRAILVAVLRGHPRFSPNRRSP